MNIAGLIDAETSAAAECVKDYCSHNYPQSQSTADLETLMGHADIADQISEFAADIAAAKAAGKPHIFGETNSGASSLSLTAYLSCI